MTPAQITALLSALSTEFSAMRETVEGLSDLMREHALLAAAADRPRVLTQAQGVDALRQELDALGDLAAALGGGRPIEGVLDAVPLADLADRLRRAVSDTDLEARPAPAATGELVLFD